MQKIWEKQPTENDKQYQAFQLFCDGKSNAEIMELTGYKERNLFKLKQNKNWDARRAAYKSDKVTDSAPTDTTTAPVISLADFRTIFLHAEKISNGQIDFVAVLRDELKNKLGIENADSFIASIEENPADSDNQTRLYLAQFNFIIEGEGVNYRLVKLNDTTCELETITADKSEGDAVEKTIDDTEKTPTDEGDSVEVINPEVNTETPTLRHRILTINGLWFNIQDNGIQIGKELTECKKEISPGDWRNFIEENFSFTYTVATRLMQIADRFSDFAKKYVLNKSQLIEMLALPKGQEENFIDDLLLEGKPLKDISVLAFRDKVRKYKTQHNPFQSLFAPDETSQLTQATVNEVYEKSPADNEEKLAQDTPPADEGGEGKKTVDAISDDSGEDSADEKVTVKKVKPAPTDEDKTPPEVLRDAQDLDKMLNLVIKLSGNIDSRFTDILIWEKLPKNFSQRLEDFFSFADSFKDFAKNYAEEIKKADS